MWLEQQPWPGNVRELANVIERAVIVAEGDSIRSDDLGAATHADPVIEAHGERERIAAALDAANGNNAAAAAALGISYRTLLRRLDEFGLRGLRWRGGPG